MLNQDVFQCIVSVNPVLGLYVNKFFHNMLEESDLGYYRKFFREYKTKQGQRRYPNYRGYEILAQMTKFKNKQALDIQIWGTHNSLLLVMEIWEEDYGRSMDFIKTEIKYEIEDLIKY